MRLLPQQQWLLVLHYYGAILIVTTEEAISVKTEASFYKISLHKNTLKQNKPKKNSTHFIPVQALETDIFMIVFD